MLGEASRSVTLGALRLPSASSNSNSTRSPGSNDRCEGSDKKTKGDYHQCRVSACPVGGGGAELALVTSVTAVSRACVRERAEMEEDITRVVVGKDESIALLRMIKLYGARRHARGGAAFWGTLFEVVSEKMTVTINVEYICPLGHHVLRTMVVTGRTVGQARRRTYVEFIRGPHDQAKGETRSKHATLGMLPRHAHTRAQVHGLRH